jgi:hypothetical protein
MAGAFEHACGNKITLSAPILAVICRVRKSFFAISAKN